MLNKAVAVLIAASALLTDAPSSAQPQPAANSGYQHLAMPDPSGAPVEIGVWYPTNASASVHPVQLFHQFVAENAPVAGRGLPLIVISHGSGGEFSGHYDLALALARAGFVVASLTQPGDNFRDRSHALDLPSRPAALKRLVDYMLDTWPQHYVIDPNRVGAFGFSAGGFTVLVSAGGEPSLSKLSKHCIQHPIFFDCKLMGQFSDQAKMMQTMQPVWVHDPRLKAVVVAAPALGFAFGRSGLKNVKSPIQLWRASDDQVLPQPYYAEAIRADLPEPPEYHVVLGAGHYDFLAPCSIQLAKAFADICTSLPGFDRATFHTKFDAEVVQFFRAKLGK